LDALREEWADVEVVVANKELSVMSDGVPSEMREVNFDCCLSRLSAAISDSRAPAPQDPRNLFDPGVLGTALLSRALLVDGQTLESKEDLQSEVLLQ
jgi:hypothetical protein